MTQAPPPSRPAKARVGLAGAKPGNPTPPHLQMELKHRIMVALGKLADRDTQQIAVEELDKLVEAISPDCVSICLSCLYDSDMQQKSVVKKECVRLFGTLASLHADLVVPHLPKIIASIMRRLRDPDSSVRDACVDAIAILSARMLSPSSSSPTGQEKENGTQAASALTLSTFSKPLFDALSEQNKSVQTGAALCLARVIESAKSPPLGAMARLCPRICKFMSNPNFLARPALLAVIGSLSQVGALAQQQLALLMPCVLEALESSDWATRKAAAETLSCVGSNLGTSLSCFKSTSLRVLESCRFDKVKPVRDSVHDATQLWKTLPGTECESPGSARKSDGPELAVAMQRLELRSPIPISKETIPVAAESPRNENKPQISSPNQLLKSSEKPFEAVKKRAPALTDKKLNPEFFQKLAARNADEWQVEVVVPRNRPPSMAQEPDMDIKEGNVEMDDLPLGSTSKRGQQETLIQDSHMVSNEKGREPTGPQSRSLIIDESPSSRSRGLRIMSVRQKEVMMGSDKNMLKDGVHNQAWEAYGHVTSLSSNSGLEASQSMNERSKWHFIQKQLTQLEQQQSSLMQMVQDIMANSQENMFVLQARVRDLEKVVEDMACEVGFSAGKRLHVGVAGHESSGFRPSGRYFPGPEYVNPRFGKSVDNLCRFADRVSVSESMSKGMRSAAYRSSEPALEDWDEFAFKGSRGGLAGAYVLDGQAAGLRRNNVEGPGDLPRTDRENSENDQIGMIRVWDRVPGPVRLGEGPSARSVWQAAKDEATLAAIRVAGEGAELSEVDALSTAVSRLGPSVSGSERLPHKDTGGGRNGKGQYWSLWGSAMEFVHAGDMESAYTEVLCAEDELMLMRLMSRTGPVLDQFTVTTATEVLHAVGQLLQQRSYFDFCLAWIQQVADMVANNGAECLDLSLDAKRELLMSLQESASMDLPDGWLGNSIDELLQQLANAWSMEIVPVGTDL